MTKQAIEVAEDVASNPDAFDGLGNLIELEILAKAVIKANIAMNEIVVYGSPTAKEWISDYGKKIKI